MFKLLFISIISIILFTGCHAYHSSYVLAPEIRIHDVHSDHNHSFYHNYNYRHYKHYKHHRGNKYYKRNKHHRRYR